MEIPLQVNVLSMAVQIKIAGQPDREPCMFFEEELVLEH